MTETGYLTNHFLIAMPNLLDPGFFHSVTYICEHNKNGAMGVIINQPTTLTIGELTEQMGITLSADLHDQEMIYRGGPVEGERGFILHRPVGHWESTMAITDEIGLTTSNDIIGAMAKGEGPNDYLITLGYAGWGPGQLETEIRDNSWLSCEGNPDIIFHTNPDQRWEAAASLIGIDIHQLTGDAGHA